MIAFRDVLIFAGLAALAAAVIASLFPAGEGVTPVPACSDCAFKLTGGYWIRQYGNYAAFYLGTRMAARYGWAYMDGRPLAAGEAVGCDPMYVHVLNGMAYVSCSGTNSTFGRRALSPAGVVISAKPSRSGCAYTVNAALNVSAAVSLYVYDEYGRLIYSASGAPPAVFNFDVPAAGIYRMRVYAPPLLDEWYTLHAYVAVIGTKAAVFKGNNTQDLRSTISLKIFDLTNYWKKGYARVTVQVNPARRGATLSAPSNAFADFLLAWEDCRNCACDWEGDMYMDEIWRLTFTPSGPVLTRIHSQGSLWHEVYADGRLIWTFRKNGPKNNGYTGSDPTISVRIVSSDSYMNAEAVFTKICAWS
jgi:hypothetical protein